ncbi:hypothetical protein LO772_24780 [Yinghuangia sp. ASG 101]|uniref:hypothetical protein n=1 Tax=Yinghuangia sp. ASG 101 TaxID=2896848 RepID=UPI001E3CEFC2|nr:hypothetical protein [Yinghuangia sp. ASG 101]UGQ10079.1 hypothetical protein LO772_24780 [Yinghuangia sp. ASG 101]
MTTTIKITSETRDRLRGWADRRGVKTLDQALNACLDAAESHEQMQAVGAAMARMRRGDPDAWAAYTRERDLWDSADDGLGAAGDEYPEYNR